MPSHANEIPAWAGPLSTRGLDKGWRSVASRPVNLGPDQPEGWSWMADTTVTHQPATESTDRTPISVIGGHLAESRGATIRGLTFGQTREGSEEGGSARVRERLEAHGGPRDRVYFV